MATEHSMAKKWAAILLFKAPLSSAAPLHISIGFLKDITDKSKVLLEIKKNQQVGQPRQKC